jgi:hypothetical protein
MGDLGAFDNHIIKNHPDIWEKTDFEWVIYPENDQTDLPKKW